MLIQICTACEMQRPSALGKTASIFTSFLSLKNSTTLSTTTPRIDIAGTPAGTIHHTSSFVSLRISIGFFQVRVVTPVTQARISYYSRQSQSQSRSHLIIGATNHRDGGLTAHGKGSPVPLATRRLG